MSTWPNRGVPPAAWQGPKDVRADRILTTRAD